VTRNLCWKYNRLSYIHRLSYINTILFLKFPHYPFFPLNSPTTNDVLFIWLSLISCLIISSNEYVNLQVGKSLHDKKASIRKTDCDLKIYFQDLKKNVHPWKFFRNLYLKFLSWQCTWDLSMGTDSIFIFGNK